MSKVESLEHQKPLVREALTVYLVVIPALSLWVFVWTWIGLWRLSGLLHLTILALSGLVGIGGGYANGLFILSRCRPGIVYRERYSTAAKLTFLTLVLVVSMNLLNLSGGEKLFLESGFSFLAALPAGFALGTIILERRHRTEIWLGATRGKSVLARRAVYFLRGRGFDSGNVV